MRVQPIANFRTLQIDGQNLIASAGKNHDRSARVLFPLANRSSSSAAKHFPLPATADPQLASLSPSSQFLDQRPAERPEAPLAISALAYVPATAAMRWSARSERYTQT